MRISRINLKNLFVLFAMVAIAATGLFVFLNKSAAAGFFGAIYDTNEDGTVTNQNGYTNKEDVYLNGGPQNENSKGLPVGVYYFQVTNPNGDLLLSTSPAVCRQVEVQEVGSDPDNLRGRIIGLWSGVPSPDCDGLHPNGTTNPANGSTAVQLFPFNDTDNPGGVYKVWLIKKEEATIQEDGIGLDFDNNDAKTDNFRVSNFCEENPEHPDCNPEPAVFDIDGLKFFDVNANGVQDVGDFPLQGFRIRTTFVPELNAPNTNDVLRFTLANGTWSILGIPEGSDYYVREDVPNACDASNNPLAGYSWQQTAPSSIITLPDNTEALGYEGTVTANVSNLNFGNRCTRPALNEGKTIGFWSNKNGQALITTADINALVAFNLKNASGGDFNPASKTAYRDWLLSANATNMAYMLSAQMSATYLNKTKGYIDGNALLDVGGQIGTINGWITEANTSLGLYPNTTSPHAQRANQERLKNIFDRINNNNFLFIGLGCTACYPE